MRPHRKKSRERPSKRRPAGVRRLREDCIEFVSQVFNFRDEDRTKTWDRATDVQWFSCPICGGEGHITCDVCDGNGEKGGEWCVACEGMGATACEDCDGGIVVNWPTRKIVYPLPENFDRPDVLVKTRFNYVIMVKIEGRFFLAYALPERQMKDVIDMPAAMIEAYIRLGLLPPAQLVCRLLDHHDFDEIDRSAVAFCRRSLTLCSRRWAKRLQKFEQRFAK